MRANDEMKDDTKEVLPTDGEPCEQADENASAQGEIAAADSENSDKRSDNCELGKFKNPQELLKAYGELEKQFTRRCQRLKELEGASVPIYKREWREAVDKFFDETPSARNLAKEMADEIIKDPSLKKNSECLDIAYIRAIRTKYPTPEKLIRDGEFLNSYILDSEEIRDRIVGEYLDSVRTDAPPRTMRNDGAQCLTPSLRPKTIEEAGDMFLKDNK